jgi:hypothetical protein
MVKKRILESSEIGARSIEFRLMSEIERRNDGGPDEMFGVKQPKGQRIATSTLVIAGLVVVAILGVLLLAGRKKAPQVIGIQPLAIYAANLPLSDLKMSESTSLSGGKSTFLDGRVRNTGNSIVSGVTVQVLFRNDENMPPDVETTPLMLIRTRDPYVDTQMIGAAPLKPGDEREFRLIFENVPNNWNQQMPEVRVVRVETK